MTNFIYLKLGGSNCLADYLLSNKNVLGKSVATIYFGPIKAEEYEDLYKMENKEKEIERLKGKYNQKKFLTKSQLKQVYNFIEASNSVKNRNSKEEFKFITVANGCIYIYKPISKVYNLPENKIEEYNKDLNGLSKKSKYSKIELIEEKGHYNNIPKIMDVEIIKKKKISDVPHVLATLPSNQFYTRNTCQKIEDKQWGASQAIKYLLKRKLDSIKNPKDLIELLSPYELETLVFLILKNSGLFVPAWRGGTQKDVDIIARNYTEKTIIVGKNPEIKFKGKEGKSFQVKKGEINKPFENADYTVITGNNTINKKFLTPTWLFEEIKNKYQQDTIKWLKNSLDWHEGAKKFLNNKIQ